MAIAAFAGNLVGYEIGRKLGPPLYERDGRILKRKYFEITERFFEKHGNKALVIGRLVPFVRTYITVVAGVTRMDRTRFFRFSAIGAVLWVLSITPPGYFLGRPSRPSATTSTTRSSPSCCSRSSRSPTRRSSTVGTQARRRAGGLSSTASARTPPAPCSTSRTARPGRSRSARRRSARPAPVRGSAGPPSPPRHRSDAVLGCHDEQHRHLELVGGHDGPVDHDRQDAPGAHLVAEGRPHDQL